MSDIKRLYPTGRGFSQVVIASGQRHVFVSGQCAFDASGDIVGVNDLSRQTEQVMENLRQGLEAADATFDDLVKMTVFVVDYSNEKRELIQEVRNRYIPPDGGPASTLIGVSKLVSDDLLIEIEAHAIVDS